MEIIEQGIAEMKPKLKALLNSEFRDFKTKYDDLKIIGVYAIYEGDEIIYIGESGNIQDRLYNHLLKLKGTHDLRTKKLCGYKNLDTNEEILDFLLKKCKFKVKNEFYRARLEALKAKKESFTKEDMEKAYVNGQINGVLLNVSTGKDNVHFNTWFNQQKF